MLSLRWLHAIFIWTTVVLAVIFSAWAVQHSRWVLAACSLLCGTWLAVYRQRFLRRAHDAHFHE